MGTHYALSLCLTLGSVFCYAGNPYEDVAVRTRIEEGYRNDMYIGPQGKYLVGIGYNIQDLGLPDEIIWDLFKITLDNAWEDSATLPCYSSLDYARQGVLAAMTFQMGIAKVRGFKDMFNALCAHDYDKAAEAMLDSVWARQTPGRARREANIMRTGIVPELRLPTKGE